MSWRVTVAAVAERNGRFLMVEETDKVHPEPVFNQPAGHLDPGETLLDAVARECLEETSMPFTPEALLGIYHVHARNGHDYLRVAFCGSVPDDCEPVPQPGEILACHWLTRDEIAAGRPRSSAVLRCIDDYLAGVRIPLSAASHVHRDR